MTRTRQILSVERARAQYLRTLATVSQSSDEAALKAATAQMREAKTTLQVAQRTSRLRRSGPKMPARHPEWNAEPT